jgi:hypothetical protein
MWREKVALNESAFLASFGCEDELVKTKNSADLDRKKVKDRKKKFCSHFIES